MTLGGLLRERQAPNLVTFPLLSPPSSAAGWARSSRELRITTAWLPAARVKQLGSLRPAARDRAQPGPCGGCLACLGFQEPERQAAERTGTAQSWHLHTLTTKCPLRKQGWTSGSVQPRRADCPQHCRLGQVLVGAMRHHDSAPRG